MPGEEERPPARPPSMGDQQAPSSALEESTQDRIKVEDEAGARAEAEAMAEAARRMEEERERIQKEQQAARQRDRLLREGNLARSRALSNAAKSAPLPPAAVIPAKKDWPLPAFIEEPAWNTPAIAAIYNSPYDSDVIKNNYHMLLKEAVAGNPRAMLVLSYAYRRWGDSISASFAVLHPAMHNSSYWQRWALQLTSADWVELRLGDLSLDEEEKIEHYKNAAAHRNSEGMYKQALWGDMPELLVESAMAGHAGASATVAFNLVMGKDGLPPLPRQAALYWWRAALAGDARSMLVCSEMFYHGQNGFPKDERRAYIFALLAVEEAQRQGPDGTLGDITGVAQRHLEGLVLALAPDSDGMWKIRQELEILKAAPEEERQARRAAAAIKREPALDNFNAELFAVRDVVENSPPNITEAQILARLEQARAEGEMEQARRARIILENQRLQDNYAFYWFAGAAVFLVLGAYLGMRLRLYAFIVRLVSVRNGEKQ